ncbi:5695_t:CDS:1, partial [Dentiscutata heterogama]
FYECHTDELRAHIKNIQNGNWSEFTEPFFSKNLKEVLSLHDEQSSHEQIEGIIEGKFKALPKEIEGMIEGRFKALPIKIEKIIKDMPILKDLKKSIEDLKTIDNGSDQNRIDS